MKPNKLLFIDINDPKKIVAIIIFILTFLAFLAEVASGFYARGQGARTNMPAKLASNQAPLRSDSPLFNTALFGDYVPNLADGDIKQSMLDFQVVGILYAPSEKDSQVIIRPGGGEDKYYFVGDTLPGGAIIKRISAKAVVVLHKGALESLSLPKNELIFDPPAKPLTLIEE